MRRDIAKQLGIKASLKSDAVPSIDLANDPVCKDVSTGRERRQALRGIPRVQDNGNSSSDSDSDKKNEDSEPELKKMKKKISNLQKKNWLFKKRLQEQQSRNQAVSAKFDSGPCCSTDNSNLNFVVEDNNEGTDFEQMSEEETDWASCEMSDSSDDEMKENDTKINAVRVEPGIHPAEEPKFVVFLSMLVSIFQMFCFNCKTPSPQVEVRRNGSMAIVIQTCKACGRDRQFKWRSQPSLFGKYHAGNVMMSFGILMSGINISQSLIMLKHMGLAAISPRTYFRHQRKFLFPSLLMHWENYRSALLRKLKNVKDAQWSGDGRFDSMGHNAKYGTYTMLSNSLSKLVHFELLQANQTGSSNAMELAGAKLCFQYIKNTGLYITTFISDRHKGIAKWIRETQPNTMHFFDLWHVGKGVTKKILKASLEKGNEILKDWMKAIRRHLYWCALSTKQGYGDLIVAKWKSIIRHIANRHEDHQDTLYQQCAHGELEPRAWLKIGSQQYDRLYGIVMNGSTLKDIKHVASDSQTSCLEGYHSTLNHWHPKMTHYSWLGTYCRHVLAILHFNENSKRQSRIAADGTKYHNVVYPKFKYGDEILREVPVPPTYDYVADVRNVMFNRTDEEFELILQNYKDKEPAPLNTQFPDRRSKVDAIERKLQRSRASSQLFPAEAEQDILINSARPIHPSENDQGKKERCCRKNKKPMKGHTRGRCEVEDG